MNYVGTRVLAGAAHAHEQSPDRIDLGLRRTRLTPGQAVNASLRAQRGAKLLDHLVTLGVHPDERAQPRGGLEADSQHAVRDAMEIVDPAVAHEGLEPDDAAVMEALELREVLGDQPTPEAEIHERFLRGDRELFVERRSCRRGWMGVQRHFENRRDTARGSTAATRFPPFPLGATRLVEMNVGIHD